MSELNDLAKRNDFPYLCRYEAEKDRFEFLGWEVLEDGSVKVTDAFYVTIELLKSDINFGQLWLERLKESFGKDFEPIVNKTTPLNLFTESNLGKIS